jgi:hypothetical protein
LRLKLKANSVTPKLPDTIVKQGQTATPFILSVAGNFFLNYPSGFNSRIIRELSTGKSYLVEKSRPLSASDRQFFCKQIFLEDIALYPFPIRGLADGSLNL